MEKDNTAGDIKEEIIRYIRSCRLDDGGYFFARVLPSGALDTYYAVHSLHLLGVAPEKPETVNAFFLEQRENLLHSVSGIYLLVKTLAKTGGLDAQTKQTAAQQIASFRNKAGGYGALEGLDVEVMSEFRDTYRAVKVLQATGTAIDKAGISNFLAGRINPDGGYGGGRSTLVSTFYAACTRHMLGLPPEPSTLDCLRRRERDMQLEFIEDIYWLVEGLACYGEQSIRLPEINAFVPVCQRRGGGFSRAALMGIATLEYTFYAVSILKSTGKL